MSEIPPIPNGTNMEGEDILPQDHVTTAGMDPFDDEDDDVVPFSSPQHIGIQMHISECHEDAEDIYGPPMEDNVSARDSVITKHDTENGLPSPQFGNEQSSESNEDMIYGRDKLTNNAKVAITPMMNEVEKGNDDDEDMYGM